MFRIDNSRFNFGHLLLIAVMACVGGMGISRCAGADEASPIGANEHARWTARWERDVEAANATLAQTPNDVQAFSRRGDARFFLARFDDAVADYTAMTRLEPELDRQHWRRGIALYYAGDYESAAAQFQRYHAFDNVDRENGIWRYFSQHRFAGAAAARKELIKYEKDDREPFPAVYRLFSGELTGDEVTASIEKSGVAGTSLESRRFYGSLYVGLNHAVEGRRDAARAALANALRNRWALSAGYGPQYMWHVGRLEWQRLAEVQRPEPPK